MITIKTINNKMKNKETLTNDEKQFIINMLMKKVANKQPNKKWKTFRNWK
jgi:hypothetical protein